jgi:hypothetical protein
LSSLHFIRLHENSYTLIGIRIFGFHPQPERWGLPADRVKAFAEDDFGSMAFDLEILAAKKLR